MFFCKKWDPQAALGVCPELSDLTVISRRHNTPHVLIYKPHTDNIQNIYKTFTIPILYEKVLLKYEGDYIKDDLYGNIKLTIEIVDKLNYTIVNDNDLMITMAISIYDYLYNINFQFVHLDNNEITININDPHVSLSRYDNDLIYIIANKGLPIDYDTDNRGQLIVRFTIDESKNGLKDNIKQICL